VASVSWRTIPTGWPPLIDEVNSSFSGQRVPRGQIDGSLWPYSRPSTPKPLLFLPSSSSIVLTRLSGTPPDPIIFSICSQELWPLDHKGVYAMLLKKLYGLSQEIKIIVFTKRAPFQLQPSIKESARWILFSLLWIWQEFVYRARLLAIRPAPNMEDQGPVFMSAKWQDCPVIPTGTRFTVVAFYNSQIYGGGILSRQKGK
jgi:hypothetical protein